jgi:hypothetical protein
MRSTATSRCGRVGYAMNRSFCRSFSHGNKALQASAGFGRFDPDEELWPVEGQWPTDVKVKVCEVFVDRPPLFGAKSLSDIISVIPWRRPIYLRSDSSSVRIFDPVSLRRLYWSPCSSGFGQDRRVVFTPTILRYAITARLPDGDGCSSLQREHSCVCASASPASGSLAGALSPMSQ